MGTVRNSIDECVNGVYTSAEMQTHVTCRGDTLEVRCSRTRRIAVQWAAYGYSRHTSNNSCHPSTSYDSGQYDAHSLRTVVSYYLLRPDKEVGYVFAFVCPSVSRITQQVPDEF